jgi:hypothetical protein
VRRDTPGTQRGAISGDLLRPASQEVVGGRTKARHNLTGRSNRGGGWSAREGSAYRIEDRVRASHIEMRACFSPSSPSAPATSLPCRCPLASAAPPNLAPLSLPSPIANREQQPAVAPGCLVCPYLLSRGSQYELGAPSFRLFSVIAWDGQPTYGRGYVALQLAAAACRRPPRCFNVVLDSCHWAARSDAS